MTGWACAGFLYMLGVHQALKATRGQGLLLGMRMFTATIWPVVILAGIIFPKMDAKHMAYSVLILFAMVVIVVSIALACVSDY